MTFPHLKGKIALLKKVSKVVCFMVSEVQAMDNGLCQPHFQDFFSPQQYLILEKTQHESLIEPFCLFASQSIQYMKNV